MKFDKNAKGPKIQLLEAAMAQDNAAESVYWAREVLKVDPDNTDAHYVLAFEELETRSPNIPEVKRHLKVLDDKNAPAIRRALIRARVAQATGDDKAGRDEAFSEARAITLPADADPIDRVAGCGSRPSRSRTPPSPASSRRRSRASSPDVKDLTSVAGRGRRPSHPAQPVPRADPARARLAVVPRVAQGGKGTASMPWSRRSRSSSRRSSRRCSSGTRSPIFRST